MTVRTPTTPRWGPITAAAGFLLAFLAVGLATDPLADRPLPMPWAPPSEVAAYYTANPAAATINALLQIVSVACLAVVVRYLTPRLREAGPGAARLPAAGYLSVAAIVVSSLLSVALVLVAPSASAATVDVLRQANFYSGGVVAVVALGVFVLGAALVLGRRGAIGRVARWFGLVAGALATLSVLSLAIFYATPLLPIGRVLCMVWTIIAAVQLVRRGRI
ncbi:hypothetical protein [Pseudonocardia adelaidensis]|uniref:DUF4386 family protein n=1 Tax=Pseudonocardia adelaidensis TaxID=648754 RepID=A0ABP9P969_9PSEU